MEVILYFAKVTENPLWFRIPLGLLSLGSALFKKGIKVTIIDGNYENDVENKIKSTVPSHDKFIFGISTMTGYQLTDSLNIAGFMRNNYPNALLVWGGWHPSLLPHDTLKNDFVDFVVMGPGEETLVKLVEACIEHSGYDHILGLGYKKDGKAIINGPRPILNFDKLPFLKWDLIDVDKYLAHDVAPRTITFLTSRGCPYRCGFCAVMAMYERKWYSLPAERVIDEIQFLKRKYRIDGIRFEDSNFFASKKRVLEISKGLIEKNININWAALGRPDDLLKYDTNELELLKKGGFSQIAVGAESADQDALDFINKDIKASAVNDLVEICIKHDISMILAFMLGLPIAKGKDIDLTLDLIKHLHSKYPFGEKNNEILLSYYVPYPGSYLYQLAIKRGFKEPSTLKEWSALTLNEYHAPWVTRSQDRKIQNAMQTCRIIKFYMVVAELLKNLNKSLKPEIRNLGLKFVIKIIYSFFKFRILNKIYFFPLSYYLFYVLSKAPIFKFLKTILVFPYRG